MSNCADPAARRATLLRALVGARDLEDSAPAAKAHAAYPGTAEKIDVITERVSRRENTYHPDDLTTLDMRSMGLVCATDANGAHQWFRPVDEGGRRSMIVAAQEALRARRRGEEVG